MVLLPYVVSTVVSGGAQIPVYGRFGPKTLRIQDCALCVWCRSVSNCCVGAQVSSGLLKYPVAPMPKCLGQFGTKVRVRLRSPIGDRNFEG